MGNLFLAIASGAAVGLSESTNEERDRQAKLDQIALDNLGKVNLADEENKATTQRENETYQYQQDQLSQQVNAALNRGDIDSKTASQMLIAGPKSAGTVLAMQGRLNAPTGNLLWNQDTQQYESPSKVQLASSPGTYLPASASGGGKPLKLNAADETAYNSVGRIGDYVATVQAILSDTPTDAQKNLLDSQGLTSLNASAIGPLQGKNPGSLKILDAVDEADRKYITSGLIENETAAAGKRGLGNAATQDLFAKAKITTNDTLESARDSINSAINGYQLLQAQAAKQLTVQHNATPDQVKSYLDSNVQSTYYGGQWDNPYDQTGIYHPKNQSNSSTGGGPFDSGSQDSSVAANITAKTGGSQTPPLPPAGGRIPAPGPSNISGTETAGNIGMTGNSPQGSGPVQSPNLGASQPNSGGTPPAPQQAAQQGQSSGLPQVQSEQDYAKLPPGAVYLDPNGLQKTKTIKATPPQGQ